MWDFERRCPFDVGFLIARQLDRRDVKSLRLTTKYFYRIAEYFLWSHYNLEDFVATTGSLEERCEAVCKDDRALRVVSCRLAITPSWKRGTDEEDRNRRALRVDTLCRMPNLKSLSIDTDVLSELDALHLLGSLSRISPTPPFLLHTFSTNMVSPHEKFFSVHSSSLEILVLPMMTTVFPSSSLVKLSTFYGKAVVLKTLIRELFIPNIAILEPLDTFDALSLFKCLEQMIERPGHDSSPNTHSTQPSINLAFSIKAEYLRWAFSSLCMSSVRERLSGLDINCTDVDTPALRLELASGALVPYGAHGSLGPIPLLLHTLPSDFFRPLKRLTLRLTSPSDARVVDKRPPEPEHVIRSLTEGRAAASGGLTEVTIFWEDEKVPMIFTRLPRQNQDSESSSWVYVS